jgi:hypothetical protein
MPKAKDSTRKSTDRQTRLVTIAFQRTFIDGPLHGLTVHGLTRDVTPAEAAGLTYHGKAWGQDGDGNWGLDRHIRVIHPGTHKLRLENYELNMEKALLIEKIVEREQRKAA